MDPMTAMMMFRGPGRRRRPGTLILTPQVSKRLDTNTPSHGPTTPSYVQWHTSHADDAAYAISYDPAYHLPYGDQHSSASPMDVVTTRRPACNIAIRTKLRRSAHDRASR
jgi:hypothetical protein